MGKTNRDTTRGGRPPQGDHTLPTAPHLDTDTASGATARPSKDTHHPSHLTPALGMCTHTTPPPPAQGHPHPGTGGPQALPHAVTREAPLTHTKKFKTDQKQLQHQTKNTQLKEQPAQNHNPPKAPAHPHTHTPPLTPRFPGHSGHRQRDRATPGPMATGSPPCRTLSWRPPQGNRDNVCVIVPPPPPRSALTG